MKNEENIIQIRQRDVRQADLAFAEFMQLVEECFNENSRKNIVGYNTHTHTHTHQHVYVKQ